MREYKENSIFSFKYNDIIKPEIQLKHIYFKRGKKYVDIFYAERTSNPNIIAIPSNLTRNHKENAPFGFVGEMKEGDFIMGKVPVILQYPHSIYNGVAYVRVQNKIWFKRLSNLILVECNC